MAASPRGGGGSKWNLWRVQVSCPARSVSARLNFVGANLRPDAVAAPDGRTLGQGRGNPPIRRTLGIDKDARLRLWAGRPLDGRCTSRAETDRKSTRLNSSHLVISYAVFC